MYSELSEALEALRHGSPPDDHGPQFNGIEAETADEGIRVVDLAGAKGLWIAEAIKAKSANKKGRSGSAARSSSRQKPTTYQQKDAEGFPGAFSYKDFRRLGNG